MFTYKDLLEVGEGINYLGNPAFPKNTTFPLEVKPTQLVKGFLSYDQT